MSTERSEPDKLRLDQWLWTARFFKTRQLSAKAISGGKIRLNGERAKPAKAVHIGDQLEIKRGPYRTVVIIEALSTCRGSASQAKVLYHETEESITNRETLAGQLHMQSQAVQYDRGKPSKRDRRAMEKLRHSTNSSVES